MSESKKLYKNRQNKMLCGVCSGVSDYLNLDVSIIRILWTLLCLTYGSGVILYFVCALILPENPNN
ncbi:MULTISPECIES: PspC domain-containing protein [Clostridium]|uniref:PspC domain-containing protein n=1 Tax=Clostridium cadaveris TaxID=1529 RepID=A0A316M951_9CLOT|nr:PspC domain-containing protein [Clostridium cadaveris]MDU4953225.1 PspC domain-containing protein [Clostridium sp.]MDM8312737.1 PspC domain-containing protein [Clostridium cadaveris]MDY4947879.1 PspC domain-containing protein [Clostridium cadaveris]NME66302.1 PspC domain-containing protein [Clostridium cadaveris]NWK11769.1 PspC domain-containing protein [Clostridium cadaveris]